jgi:hypothetical protein
MSLARLQELSSLHQAAQPTQVDEAKKSTKDFHGVQDFINDSIADLEDSIGKGGSIAAFADAAVAAKLVKALEAFKKTVEGALTDIEVELMSGEAIPAKKLGESLQLNEVKDYADSGDFTDDLFGVSEHINKMKQTVRQPRWSNWMRVTDDNFSTSSSALNDDFVAKLKELDTAFDALENELHTAS